MKIAENLFLNRETVEQVETFLKNPSGGILLYGEKGQGKYLLARQMAVKLLGATDVADLSVHPDYVEITSEEAVIKLEALEPLKKAVPYAAVSAERKVFLIDDADLMTPNAQNSLLKVLEDMNDKTVIIMVCHAPLLQTVHSRCHVIEFHSASTADMIEYLKKTSMPVDELTVALSRGCIGRYFEFKERKNYLLDVRNFLSVFPRCDSREMFISLSLIKEKDTNNFFEKYSTEDVRVFMRLLYDVFNEMLLCVAVPGTQSSFAKFIDIETAKSQFSVDRIMHGQDLLKEHLALSKRKGAYTKNDFFDLVRHL